MIFICEMEFKSLCFRTFIFLLQLSASSGALTFTQQNADDTVILNLNENENAGIVDTTNGLVEVTSDGSLTISLIPQNIGFQLYILNDPIFRIESTQSFDYENQLTNPLVVGIVAFDIDMTATVMFSINIVDVDDVAPVWNDPDGVDLYLTMLAGTVLTTVAATDADGTAPNQVVVYGIKNGNNDGVLGIDENTGVVSLVLDATAVNRASYSLNIWAYSVSTTNTALRTETTLEITNIADTWTPVCSNPSILADSVELTTIVANTTAITFSNGGWTCTDDGSVTYTVGTLTPPNTDPIFSVDYNTGALTIIRSFSTSETASNTITVQIIASDRTNTDVPFSVMVPVTFTTTTTTAAPTTTTTTTAAPDTTTASASSVTLTCLPNPRRLYVRMDWGAGAIVESDLNCTTTTASVSYVMTQIPRDTFELDTTTYSKPVIKLRTAVTFLRFYSLTVKVTEGSLETTLTYKVKVQMRRCGISAGHVTWNTLSAVVMMTAQFALIFIVNLLNSEL